MHFELSRMIWLGCNQVSEEENTKHGGSQPYNWAAYEIGNNLNNWNWNGWRKYRKSNQTQIKESWWETSKPPQKTTPIIHVTSNLFFLLTFSQTFFTFAQVGDLHRCLHIHMYGRLDLPPHSTETWDFVMDCSIMQTFQSWLHDKKIRYHKNYQQSDLSTEAQDLMSMSKRSN